jgi:hypothetical protein
MEFKPYNPYEQDYESAENERLTDELFNDEMRAEAQKALEINLDEGLEAIYEDDYRNEFDENELTDQNEDEEVHETIREWRKRGK